MHHGKRAIIAASLVLGGCLLAAGVPAAAEASYPSACSVTEAHARVHRAARAVERAEARLREARYVLGAARTYTGFYGSAVGRWVWLARRVGWSKVQMPTLMLVVDRESGGDPLAKNPASTASGLLQMLAFHWDGTGSYGWRFSPFSPRQNLRHGWMLWRRGGWAPWAL